MPDESVPVAIGWSILEMMGHRKLAGLITEQEIAGGDWISNLRDASYDAAGTAFFFKQWGGLTPKSGGRELDGRTWDEIPARATAGQEVPAHV